MSALPRLRHRADVRTLAFLAVHAGSVGLAFALRPQLPWWGVAAWVGLLCVQAFMTAVITHNTVHVPMFDRRWANRAAQVAISALYGGSVSVFVRGHNHSHHRHLQTPRDLMRTTKMRFRWNLLNQLFFVFAVGPAIERGNAVFIARERAANTPWYRQHRVEKWAVRLVTIVLVLVDWKSAILFVLIPRGFGIWGISGINYVQHDGCDVSHPVNHSRNFVSPVLNWFLVNNGYHSAHHNAPHVHWSELPAYHAREIAPHLHPALAQRSLAEYCWHAYVWPGKRVTWDGRPVVLPPPEPDQSWLPDTLELDAQMSIGAVGRQH